MANGRVVFDGATGELTDAASRELYGVEVHEAFSGELATPVGATAAA
jgi:phosphonate transport system ATP-binding protein